MLNSKFLSWAPPPCRLPMNRAVCCVWLLYAPRCIQRDVDEHCRQMVESTTQSNCSTSSWWAARHLAVGTSWKSSSPRLTTPPSTTTPCWTPSPINTFTACNRSSSSSSSSFGLPQSEGSQHARWQISIHFFPRSSSKWHSTLAQSMQWCSISSMMSSSCLLPVCLVESPL